MATPLKRAPERLVVLLGNKLIGLDSILPVVMELKAEAPALDVTFLFLNRAAVSVVERNYALRDAMAATGRTEILAEGGGNPIQKALAGLRLLRWMARMLVRCTLLLSYADLGRFPFKPLAWSARRGGGSACTYCKTSYPGNDALNYVQGLKTAGRDMRWHDSGDAFFIYHPTQMQDYAGYNGAPVLLVGTPRRLPAWRAFLDKLASAHGIHDERGRDLTSLPSPVFVVFYPGPVVIPHQTDNVRETFLRMLDILAEETPGATIVIKPHPVCDLDLLGRDIADRNALDIRISHAHPQLLMRIATVAISTNASNVIYDCYMEGVPVIETSRYQPDVLARGESLYPNRGRIGCPDEVTLRAAVRRAVTSPASSPAPDLDALVWPKPATLASVVWGG